MNIFEEIKYNFQQRENGLVKLILVNVIIFVVLSIFWVIAKLSKADYLFLLIYNQFMLPAEISGFIRQPWTLFTYFFAHSIPDLLHILFNMLFLYWFGKIISEYIGNRRLINLYILGGLTGAVVFLLLFNFFPYFVERSQGVRLVGASGSVYAVVVGAATLVPHYRFHLLFLGPVKITYIAAFFVFGSFIGTIGDNSGGNVCHLGGALLGFLYVQQLRNGRDLGKPINYIANLIKNISKPKMKVTYRSAPKGKAPGEPSQEEIDRILDKISRSGYESLTKSEKEMLFKASEKGS